MMIHRSGNPFMHSQHGRQPMHLNSCLSFYEAGCQALPHKKAFVLRFSLVLRGNEPTPPTGRTLALDLAAVRGTSIRSDQAPKFSYLLSAGCNRLKGGNGINGRGPLRGKDAVYAGSALEPVAPRAPGRATTLSKPA